MTANSEAAAPWYRRVVRLASSPIVFQCVLVVALVAVALLELDRHTLARAFAHARYEYLAAIVPVVLVARMLHAIEWRLSLTRVGPAPLFGLTGVLLIGTLVNTIAPANTGDLAKVQIAANRYGLPRAGLIGARGAEAIVNAVIMCAVVTAALALPGGAIGSSRVLLAVAAVTAGLTAAALVAGRLLPERIPDWRSLGRLPLGIGEQLRDHWPRLHAGFEVVRRPRLLGINVVLNIVGWGLDILVVWLYGQAFHLAVPFDAYVAVAVGIAVVTVVPLTFGNIGSYELVVTSVLALYGVSASSALAFALATHVFAAVFNIGLGLAAVWMMRLHPRELFLIVRRPGSEPVAEGAATGSRS